MLGSGAKGSVCDTPLSAIAVAQQVKRSESTFADALRLHASASCCTNLHHCRNVCLRILHLVRVRVRARAMARARVGVQNPHKSVSQLVSEISLSLSPFLRARWVVTQGNYLCSFTTTQTQYSDPVVSSGEAA